MAGFLKALRLLGDESRVRVLRVLQQEELSVADLQEILGMGQSRISMQLSLLKNAGLVEARRVGQKNLYHMATPLGSQDLLSEMLRKSGEEIQCAAEDDSALAMLLRKRKDKLRGYFDELAGRFGRNYVPGRSWKSLAEMLLQLLPPLVIVDIGAGEGTMSLLLAQRAEKVIAVDNSEKMVAYGSEVAQRNGVENLEYRLGDLEELPLSDGEADLALLHQSLHHALHPRKAIAEAARVLRPGGRIVVVDLLKHNFEDARDLYADVWLGFARAELANLLTQAGFEQAAISVVHREDEAPHFETLLAIAIKLGGPEPH